MRRARITYYILRGIVRRYRGRIIFAAIFLGVLIPFLPTLNQILITDTQKTYVEGMVGKFKRESLPAVVENTASMGLTKIMPNGEAAPSAAERWDVSDDGRDYKFYLRSDLHWHDGSPFIAQDLTYLFEGIETKIVSPTEVDFHLKNPYSPFPTLLAKPLFKGKQLLGLGKYKFTSIEESGGYLTSVSLESVEKPKMKMEFKFYPTSQDVLTAYKLGELKAAYGFFNPQELANWPTVSLHKKQNYRSYIGLFFKLSDKTLEDKTVRQALLFAIPKDIFPGEPAISPIPPSSWAYNPDVKEYVYDINHAKELLAKTDVANQEFTLTTTPAYASLANTIADNWRKVNVNVKVAVVQEIPKDYQIALIRQEIPQDPDQYLLWHSLQKETNLTGYSKERVDKLLEDARETSNIEDRRAKYLDFQRFLVEDAPAGFLYYPYEYLLINKRFDTPLYRQMNAFE